MNYDNGRYREGTGKNIFVAKCKCGFAGWMDRYKTSIEEDSNYRTYVTVFCPACKVWFDPGHLPKVCQHHLPLSIIDRMPSMYEGKPDNVIERCPNCCALRISDDQVTHMWFEPEGASVES